MRAPRIHQRAIRLEAHRERTETDRCLRCLAAELGIALETLRAEALALHVQCAERGLVTIEAKLAFVADELSMPVDELRRAVEETVIHCQ